MARSQRQTLLSESLNSFMFQNNNVQKDEKTVTEKVNSDNTSNKAEETEVKEEKMTEKVNAGVEEKESVPSDIKEEYIENETVAQQGKDEEIAQKQLAEESIEKEADQVIKMPSGLLPGSKNVSNKEIVDERVEKNKERIKGDFLAHEVEDVAKLARGRKGAKLERKFISLTKSNQEYLDKQSRYYGMNATTFINYIIEEYKMKNPPLYQNLITIEHNLREED